MAAPGVTLRQGDPVALESLEQAHGDVQRPFGFVADMTSAPTLAIGAECGEAGKTADEVMSGRKPLLDQVGKI